MGYKANDEIEVLDYDFGPYCPEIKGVTPEPSSDAIKTYWSALNGMIRRQREDTLEWQARLKKINDDDASGLRAFDEEYAAWQEESADKRLDQRRKMLAALCSDQPSVADLEQVCVVSGRSYDSFEAYMQDAITPKGSKNALN